MINVKKKGNKGENKFANWLVKNGIKAWKDSASGGGNNEKADIGNNLNLHFEVKTVKIPRAPFSGGISKTRIEMEDLCDLMNEQNSLI